MTQLKITEKEGWVLLEYAALEACLTVSGVVKRAKRLGSPIKSFNARRHVPEGDLQAIVDFEGSRLDWASRGTRNAA